jgi:hypothetical protein
MRIEVGVQPNHSSWSFSTGIYVSASELRAKGLASLLDHERRDTRNIVAQLVERALSLMDPSAFAPRRESIPKGFRPFESVRDSVLPYAGQLAKDMLLGPERLYLDRASGQGGDADPPHTPPPYHYSPWAIQCRFYQAWMLARALGVSEIVVEDDVQEHADLAPLKCVLTFEESDRIKPARRRRRRGQGAEPEPRPARNTITVHNSQVGLLGNLLQAIAPFASAYGFSVFFADPAVQVAFAHYYLTYKEVRALPGRIADAEDRIKTGSTVISTRDYRLLVRGLRVPGQSVACRRLLMALPPDVKTLTRALASSSMILGAHTWKIPTWVDDVSERAIAEERSREERFLKALGCMLRSQRAAIPADAVLTLIKTAPFEPEMLAGFYRDLSPEGWDSKLTSHILRTVGRWESVSNKWKQAFGIEANAKRFANDYVTPIVRVIVTHGRRAHTRALCHQLTLALLQDGAALPVDEELARLLTSSQDEALISGLLKLAQRVIGRNLDDEHTRIENLLMLFSHTKAHRDTIRWAEQVLGLGVPSLFLVAGLALRRLDPALFTRHVKEVLLTSGKPVHDLRAAPSWMIRLGFTGGIDELAMGHLVQALKDGAITHKMYRAIIVGETDWEAELWGRIEAAAISEKACEEDLAGRKLRNIVPVLLHGLTDADGFVRENCATAISKASVRSAQVEIGLIHALTSDERPDVRAAAAKAIGHLAFSSSRAMKALSGALKENPFVETPPDWSRGDVRDEALRALCRIGARAVPTLLRVRVNDEVDGLCTCHALNIVRPDLAEKHWIDLQIQLRSDAKYRCTVRKAIRQELAHQAAASSAKRKHSAGKKS